MPRFCPKFEEIKMSEKYSTHCFSFKKAFIEITEFPFDPGLDGYIKIDLKGQVLPDLGEYLEMDELHISTIGGINVILHTDKGFIKSLERALNNIKDYT